MFTLCSWYLRHVNESVQMYSTGVSETPMITTYVHTLLYLWCNYAYMDVNVPRFMSYFTSIETSKTLTVMLNLLQNYYTC